MNDDQLQGRIDEAKGSVKNAVGRAVGNRRLVRKGKLQSASGKVQADVGDMEADIRKSIEADATLAKDAK
jgi:uncharacterized protein YjbJ (UPF0337 family)